MAVSPVFFAGLKAGIPGIPDFSALSKVFRVRHHSNLLYFACHLCSTVMYLYSMNILLRVTLVIVQIFVTFQLNNYRIAHTPIIKSAFQPLVKVA